MSIESVETIDHENLQTVSGGAGLGPPMPSLILPRPRAGANVIDAVAPNQVGVNIGPVSLSWNVPDRPANTLLDRLNMPRFPWER
jgi:hypothetical protein